MNRKQKKLYTVANAHLDTQWNWTIQDTIRDCVKNTLVQNFELMDKYPNYRMNFEGAFRYKLAKEYYPDLYEKLKGYIAKGQWNVAGSTWDAMDVNVPSSEALMRQILYGNGFFEKEFGKKSTDIFLTDCFGFRYSLPSIAAHMGLNGFSTQKLVWGVGSPIYEADGTVSKPMPDKEKPRMDLGKWVGPDGNYVVASFLQGDYTYNFDRDFDKRPINQRQEYLEQIEHNEKYTGQPLRSMYYGTGDYGGSCREISAKMVDEAVRDNGNGLFEVVSASTDQIYNELTPEERDALPAYDGELLIPHGSGAITSHTISKRWNRKNELLADSAERAAVIADWLGTAEYPAEKFLEAWQTFLWHQFHDDLPGTSIAEAYVFAYNDYVIALNMFAAELENAVGGIVRTLDTNVEGTPVVVYNPVSCERNDVIVVKLEIKTPYVRVFDAHNHEVPAQISEMAGNRVVEFVAKVAPVSCTVFDIRESELPSPLISNVSVHGNILENQRYIVTIDENGDISSIIDKENDNFELLKSPVQLEIGPDTSCNWPSWELVWTDSLETPKIVRGKTEITVIEKGPAVAAIKVKRDFGASSFEQIISLWDGGQRVDVENWVEWYERKSNLRAAFPLNVSNPKASFDLGLGVIESGNTDNYPYYQHVCHQWADLTAEDGSYGVSIMNDCKYGMDKPNDNTLRLTLIHTPKDGYSERSGQEWQDMGLNIFMYSIAGHKGSRSDTNNEAAALNQWAVPFAAEKHDGIGRELSFVSVSDEQVIVRCVKKEEKGKRIIVRVQETSGKGSKDCKLRFAANLSTAVETNGYEEELQTASYEGNTLTFTLTPYAVKTFAVQLERCEALEAYKAEHNKVLGKGKQMHLELPYDKKVTSCNSDRTAGEFAQGISIPAELYAETVVSGGIEFQLAPADVENAVVCAGQTITLPEGYDKLYFLAASTNGDKTATFFVDAKSVEVGIQDFKENVGSWDMMVNGASCVIKKDEIAAAYTHTHDAQGDRLYLFSYLFKYALDISDAKEVTLPSDSDILMMAMTVAENGNQAAKPLARLYDTIELPHLPTHKLTVEGGQGSGIYPEGRLVLVHTSKFHDGKVFAGWEGTDMIAEFESAAVVRIPDYDVYVKALTETLGEDVLLNKPYKASGAVNEREQGLYALNGNDTSKWCVISNESEPWLEVDAEETVEVAKWFVMHSGVHESSGWNTRAFKLEYKIHEEDEWKIADQVRDNESSMTLREFSPVKGRYFRLWIDQATQNPKDNTARIYMFQVFRN